MKSACPILILSLSFFSGHLCAKDISPGTLKEAESYSSHELQGYKQTEYKIDDAAGDYALLKRSQLIPQRIVAKLTGVPVKNDYFGGSASTETYEDEALQELETILIDVPKKEAAPPMSEIEKFIAYCQRNPNEASMYGDLYNSFGQVDSDQMEKLLVGVKNIGKPIQGRENPFLRDGFKKMFAQIISEEREKGIAPSLGKPHEWSKEFLDKYGKSSPMLLSSKLLMTLAVGETSRYMRTEKEGDLYKWILKQEDNSLGIADVFRQSYILNDGDIYKAILTVENILSNRRRDKARESLPFIKKLKSITSGHEYDSDKFGTWYHFFGIMLYGYAEGGVKANLIGRIENLGSVILSRGTDKTQKGWMNKEGGLIGHDLFVAIKNKDYLSHKSDPKYLDTKSYMNSSEDFRDRIHVPLDKTIKSNFSVDQESRRAFVDLSDLKKRGMKKCSVEIFPDYGKGFDGRHKQVIKNFEIKDTESTVYLHNTNIKRVRGFVTCDGSSDSMAFETNRVD